MDETLTVGLGALCIIGGGYWYMTNIARPSAHFSWHEFEASAIQEKYDNYIANEADAATIRTNIRFLAQNVLEPLRAAMGQPIIINSGFRNLALNTAIGGNPSSQHMRGEAADIGGATWRNGWTPDTCMEWLHEMRDELPLDQIIVYDTFVHISTINQNNPRRGLRQQFLRSNGSSYWSWEGQ